MRILVLGGAGMAGHVVALYLREKGHEVDTLSARNILDDKTYLIDVTNTAQLLDFFGNHTYDVVVNCIGVLVKQSEERKDMATYLNSFLPHQLERHFRDSQIKLIHLSTDCVFSGHNAPYTETSAYDGDTFYDRSKALGEVINDKDLTFRMSIIGPELREEGIGLFNWFYAQTGTIGGYTKAIWNGVTTIELARGIEAAITQNLTGLYHLTPKENISKFDLLQQCKQTFGRQDITIEPSDKVVLDKTLTNTRTDFDFSVQNYAAMADDMKRWIESHTSIYPHYVNHGQ